MGLLCRLFGHKFLNPPRCARCGFIHPVAERRRALRFGSPDDYETPGRLRDRDNIGFMPAAEYPMSSPVQEVGRIEQVSFGGLGGESGGGGASASWDSAPSADFSDVSSSVSSTESFRND